MTNANPFTTTENGEIGYARNTASVQGWLDRCEAVVRYDDLNDDVIVFEFDPEIEVSVVPPGVYFDEDLAIGEDGRAIAAAKREWNAKQM